MTSPDTQPEVTREFQREERFIVVKRKHLDRRQENNLRLTLKHNGIETVECVVVESDWPEYETVWSMIEARCTGKPTLQAKLDAAEADNSALFSRINGLHSTLDCFQRVLDFDVDGPCPICAGVEGCTHTLPERIRAAIDNLLEQGKTQ